MGQHIPSLLHFLFFLVTHTSFTQALLVSHPQEQLQASRQGGVARPSPASLFHSRYGYNNNNNPIISTTTSCSAVVDNNKNEPDDNMQEEEDVVDIAIVGAGIGGLCAGAILNTLYGKKVGVYESHYLPGGCAHAFDRKAQNGMTFIFDSGPTILLGCSMPPFSALRQVLEAVNQKVEWIRYDGWGMIENPGNAQLEKRWKCQLGPDHFQQGPLKEFAGKDSLQEFEALRQACQPLVVGAAIPAMAMRPGPSALVPLLKYFPTLVQLLQRGEELTGTFDSYMNGPNFVLTNPWLRDWLDALAFSLSGLPASRTAAAAMAFVLEDMHKENASLDYPQGGLGKVIDALVDGLEQGSNGSKLNLKSHVDCINFDSDDNEKLKAAGLTLQNGKRVIAREGVICNAPVWSLKKLLKDEQAAKLLLNNDNPVSSSSPEPPQTWMTTKEEGSSIHLTRPASSPDTTTDDAQGLLDKCDTAEMTGSFLHLHVAIDSKGLDLSKMEAHYTVMDRGLSGDAGIKVNGVPDGPCGEHNMIAVSNPCVIDSTLAPEGYMVLHAYGAGNEPYEIWKQQQESSDATRADYERLKEERAEVLWRAMESVIPDIRKRVVLDMVGSPLTHERFLRRPKGTYGAATEDYFKDGKTPIDNFVLAGDSIFPGIGVPSVAISGASAANAFVNPFQQWQCLDKLKEENKLQV